MKTRGIILSIVGFALTSISFGQLLSQSEGSELFYKVNLNDLFQPLAHHVDEYPERWPYGDQFEAPPATISYYEPYEAELKVESWMIEPFVEMVYEEDLQVESWMIEPFAETFYEEDIQIESWMIEPFVETFYEEDLQIESWMLEPFAEILYEEDLKVEAWMISAWI